MQVKGVVFLSFAASFFLAGCAIGPDYKRVDMTPPTSYRFADSNESTKIDLDWWRSFGDEKLTQTIEIGLSQNFDIKSAEAQVNALLGQFEGAKSYLYPHINGSASLDRKRVEGSTNQNLKNGLTNSFSASLVAANYEIDLFGKVRRATEAARAMLLASEYARRVTVLSVSSAIAASYVKLSSIKAQIEAARESYEAAKEIERITQIKYEHGIVGEFELLSATAQKEALLSALSSLEALKISEESNLNLLLAKNPSPVEVSDIQKIAVVDVKAGIPSEILSNRPDIAASEQALIAANAKIGIAKGAYFPSISLTGVLGNQSAELKNLFSSPTKIWQLGGSVNLPLFSAGAIEGGIKEAEAGRDDALARYQKTVIAAFNEVDNAIGQNYLAKKQYEANKKRAEALEQAYKNAKLRYEVGSISYTDMLVAFQNWLAAKQQMIIAKQNYLIWTINLYKALGGGWQNGEKPKEPSYLPAGR